MKKVSALVVALAAAVLSMSSVFAVVESGAANLHPIDQSGIAGQMSYVDDQASKKLTVTGTATGLDPTKTYLSLFYDLGSKPSGPVACEPSARDNLSFAQMLIGFWKVNADGTGTLTAVKAGPSYVSLDQVHTQSIRQFVTFGPPPVAPVRACGEVHHSEGNA